MIHPSDLRARLPGLAIACAMVAAIGLPETGNAQSTGIAPPGPAIGRVDWHLDPAPFKARADRSADGATLTLDNGLVRRVLRLENGCATIALDDLAGDRSLLRAVGPEALVTIDGTEHRIGGLVGQPNRAFLLPAWLAAMSADPEALRLTGIETGVTVERFPWKRSRHHAPAAAWPPPGVSARLDFAPAGDDPPFTVSVHYELYDGLPAFSKWIVVTNRSGKPLTVDRFTAEHLAPCRDRSGLRRLWPRTCLPPCRPLEGRPGVRHAGQLREEDALPP